MAERNLPKKGLEKQMLLGSQHNHNSKETKKTNFFEEAWRRELEYQERIKMRQKQPFVGSTSVPIHAQGSPSKPNLAGAKRKAISPSFQQQECQNHQEQQQLQPQVLKPQTQVTQSFKPTPQRLLSKPSLQAPKEVQHAAQEFKLPQHLRNKTAGLPPIPQRQRLQHKSHALLRNPSSHSQEEFKNHQHLPKLTSDQLPPRQTYNHVEASSSQMTSLWCDLCKVPCMNDFNLKQHCQGKKHKANYDKASRSKNGTDEKTAFCRECNIECPNEMSLAQHRLGKKHALRLIDLGVLKVPNESLMRIGHL